MVLHEIVKPSNDCSLLCRGNPVRVDQKCRMICFSTFHSTESIVRPSAQESITVQILLCSRPPDVTSSAMAFLCECPCLRPLRGVLESLPHFAGSRRRFARTLSGSAKSRPESDRATVPDLCSLSIGLDPRKSEKSLKKIGSLHLFSLQSEVFTWI
jgi:hypothetical protein